MKVGRVTLEEEEAAKRERYSQVLSVEKLRFAERPQAGTRCEETRRRDATCKGGTGTGFTGSTLCLPHETPPRRALPDRMSRAEN